MADVYDFKTGQLCKCCTSCKYWKGATDFPKGPGKYERDDICRECSGHVEPVGVVEVNDEVA